MLHEWGGGGVCSLTYYFDRLNCEKQQHFCKNLQYLQDSQEIENDSCTDIELECQTMEDGQRTFFLSFQVVTNCEAVVAERNSFLSFRPKANLFAAAEKSPGRGLSTKSHKSLNLSPFSIAVNNARVVEVM